MKNKRSNNSAYAFIIGVLVLAFFLVSYITALTKLAPTDDADISDESDNISSEIESSVDIPDVSVEPIVPETKYTYYDKIAYKEITVNNTEVSDGSIAIIKSNASSFPNVNESDLASFWTLSSQHDVYGLSGIGLYAYEAAVNNIDALLLNYYNTVPDNGIIIDKAFVSRNESDASIDFTGTDIDLLSGYSVRFSRIPGDEDYKFLTDQAFRYGVIQRYADNKEKHTGFEEDRSIFRYVGLEHSEYMNFYNFSLEEYIDKLRTEKVIEFESKLDKKVAYVMYYIPLEANATTTTVKVPSDNKYQYSISGDGSKGFVVVVKHPIA